MTHRSEIVTLDVNMTASEVEQVLRETPFAAYPVVAENLDNVEGVVTLKELVLHLGKPNFSLSKIMQKPVYFPENMTVSKALEQLK